MEYWIDGHFHRAYNSPLTWYCHDRGIYVPKVATLRRLENRIYIDPNFAESQIRFKNTKILRNTDKNDLHLMAFVKALNTEWKKVWDEVDKPPTSLPEF